MAALLCLWEGGDKNSHSSWEPVGFLAWVFSSQQPKLVDFKVLSHVSSAPSRFPPSSPEGLKRKTSQAKKHFKGAKKKAERILGEGEGEGKNPSGFKLARN